MDILVGEKQIASKSEFRRLVTEGAVSHLDTGEKVTDPNIMPSAGQTFKLGKKTFIKIV